ncbi:hypothetical protein LBYZC6_52270 [Lacrimispora brassicae]
MELPPEGFQYLIVTLISSFVQGDFSTSLIHGDSDTDLKGEIRDSYFGRFTTVENCDKINMRSE